jgi:charged multivesicular body protein 3
VNLKQVETKTRNLILQASKRAARDSQRQTQALREMREFARILISQRNTSARLVTSKAQLHNVQMQVSEAFALRGIEGSIRAIVGVMRNLCLLPDPPT